MSCATERCLKFGSSRTRVLLTRRLPCKASLGSLGMSRPEVGVSIVNVLYKAKRPLLRCRSYSLSAYQASRFINGGILGSFGT
jgi:hypothetical protein